MELNLHPIATKCFVSGRDFAEHDRVVSYLVREAASTGSGQASGEVARRDLLESEDGKFMPPAFVYCRWVTADFRPRRDDNTDRNLKFTAENLFLTLATAAGAGSENGIEDGTSEAINTPLLQFLALMLERKKILKPRGLSADRSRQLLEHMPSHVMYEVPVGDLNAEFFQKIQEHLGVLVGTPKPKAVPVTAPAAETTPAQPVAPAEPVVTS
ncbi:hypothetical protein Verru16b_03159 [Lacunisphaera limnophila]|uniref:Uncharacterized protein n=1 Tax=Lacunisphaera limnophila TaxID=1838286 RepID=A0A1D8AYX4_9BACT|nr:hypothetical protein [Lacunisphaera limnophila]AOS46064.1 hypothetical protein Verru16b_03159 [Lacunisphaera limnophila]